MRAAASNSTTALATVAARWRERRVLDRLLHPGRPGILRAAAPRLDRRAIDISRRSWPRRSRIACIRWRRKPIVSTTRSPSARCPTIWDRLAERGVDKPLLLQRRAVPGVVGSEVPPDQPYAAGISRRRVRQAGCRRCRSSIHDSCRRRRRHAERRPPACGHPRRPGVSEPDLHARVARSPAWRRTVLDHQLRRVGRVLRPRAADHGGRSAGRSGCRQRWPARASAYRVIVVSPFARRAFVASTEFDHTSILKLIEWRWGLGAAHREGRGGEQPGRGARLQRAGAAAAALYGSAGALLHAVQSVRIGEVVGGA